MDRMAEVGHRALVPLSLCLFPITELQAVGVHSASLRKKASRGKNMGFSPWEQFDHLRKTLQKREVDLVVL